VTEDGELEEVETERRVRPAGKVRTKRAAKP
jgi:hypothetical protein